MQNEDFLRETWVDLDNGGRARQKELRDAWQDVGHELTSGAPAIELDAEEVEESLTDNELLVFVMTPYWLGGPDGTLSYSEMFLRNVDGKLYDRQRDYILERQEDAEQWTLSGWGEA